MKKMSLRGNQRNQERETSTSTLTSPPDEIPEASRDKGKAKEAPEKIDGSLQQALDEDGRNVGLQQQILNSLTETEPEVIQKVKEEARERTYQEFLEWRERDRQERLATIDKRSKSTAKETVAVSDTMIQRLSRMAGKDMKLTQEDDKVTGKRPIDYLAPSSHLGKILVGLGDGPPSDDGSDSGDDREKKADKPEGKGSVKGWNDNEKVPKEFAGMKLKPIRPNKYNGALNPRKFLRFAKEAFRLVKDGNVPEHRQVDIISYWLEDRAYGFYERTCGDCPEEWTLKDFLIQLYNYIFPLSFRTEQRQKLKTLTQHGRRIREYVGEFEDLCDIIGITDERGMVTMLWDGFDSHISAGLYNRDLHPERSSFKDVISAAEMVELVEGVKKGNNTGRTESKRMDNGRLREPEGSKSREPNREGRRPRPKPRFKNFDQRNGRPSGSGKSSGFSSRKDSKEKRKLTDTERKELHAARKCYTCRKEGHFARDCPENTTVKGEHKKTNKPPGLPSYNVEFALAESLWESITESSGLLLGSVRWFDDAEMTYHSGSSSLDDKWGEKSVGENPPDSMPETPVSRFSQEDASITEHLQAVNMELEEWIENGGWGPDCVTN
ncbi:hypothetical protein V5O48_019141, partial [Marasmius crinis-equi]